jgi:DNA-binding transcriptional regulator YdaS (Cro superfamily)
MSPLETAVAVLKGQAALAGAIGVKQQHIWNWINRAGGKVPAEHCPAIERATNGAVRCEDLRPDVAWDVLRMQSGQGDPQQPGAKGAPRPPLRKAA